MTKNIFTLIEDIYEVVKEENWLTDARLAAINLHLSENIAASPRRVPELRLSQMGPKCPNALWHSIHLPSAQEPLPPWARIKYTYGHVIEALIIAMAKAAGHEVTGEQDVVSVDGVLGHRDCVIDGCVVDVKSASSRSFLKFKDGSIALDDPFGYLDQLDGYLVGSLEDPLVRVKDRGYLLAVDKQLGHLALYQHRIRENGIRERIREAKQIIDLPSAPPCTCGTVPDGKSGNIKLDVKASYNPYKYTCNPGLRTFLYANGPTYLTKVVRPPNVTEVDKYGKMVYN